MEQSTDKVPIYFFEKYFNNEGIDELRNIFYSGYIEHESNCSINDDNESVTFTLNAYDHETGEHINRQETVYFRNILERTLEKELTKSKRLIGESLLNAVNPNAYLELLLNDLIQINDKSIDIQKKYSFCTEIINDLINNIKTKLGIKVESLNSSNRDYLNGLFGFLKDYEYMSEVDWERLINYLDTFLNSSTIPNIPSKFDIPKIKKREFYLLFYILYKKYNRDINLELISEFIIKAFNGFEERTGNNLLKKISDSKEIKISNLPIGFPKNLIAQ